MISFQTIQNKYLIVTLSMYCHLSHVQLFATPWTTAHQAPLSIGFSKQEYWSGLPFPSPGDLPNPVIKSRSSALQADSLPSESPGKPNYNINLTQMTTIHQIPARKYYVRITAEDATVFQERSQHTSTCP